MFKKITAGCYIPLISRFCLGLVFIISGIAKLGNGIVTANYLGNISVLPDKIVHLTESILPGVEIIVGCFFIGGLVIKSAAFLSLIMSIVFIIINIFNITSGINDCGCFGAVQISPIVSLCVDVTLLAMSTILLFSNTNKFSLDSWLNLKK